MSEVIFFFIFRPLSHWDLLFAAYTSGYCVLKVLQLLWWRSLQKALGFGILTLEVTPTAELDLGCQVLLLLLLLEGCHSHRCVAPEQLCCSLCLVLGSDNGCRGHGNVGATCSGFAEIVEQSEIFYLGGEHLVSVNRTWMIFTERHLASHECKVKCVESILSDKCDYESEWTSSSPRYDCLSGYPSVTSVFRPNY